MVYHVSLKILTIVCVLMMHTEQVSSAALPGTDQVPILQVAEREFYKKYCSFWGLMPERITAARKPVHRYRERIMAVGASEQCIDLMLKVDYQFPSAEQMKPLKESKLPIIWVLGGPGSGKGTLCGKFKETESYTHISVGDLLRAEVESPPSPTTGQLLQQVITQGQLVPKMLPITLLVKKMLSVLGSTQGILIDGFPRAVDQGVLFQTTIRAPDAIIVLEVSEDTMRKRVLNRNQGRADDNEEVFQKRLKVYRSQSVVVTTNPLFAKKVKRVNAEGDVDENFKLFSAAIKESLKPSHEHQ